MGGLKDQLLKSGLVSEQQIKKAQLEKRKEIRQSQGKTNPAEEEKRQQRQAAQAEKAERDRLLNLQRKQEADKKATVAQIRQLIEANRQPADGDILFNFAHEGKVKRMYVSEAAHRQIVRGQLAIVKLERRYELVPAEIADKIRERDASVVIVQNSSQPNRNSSDDPYAAYEVPDDLMW